MCYYIGIEDLVANALIEIVEKTSKRDVSFKQLNEYGAAIIEKLKLCQKEVTLIFTRDKTNAFFHDCSEYFTIKDMQDDVIISLKDGVSTDVLRQQFRVNISLTLLKAFVAKDAVSVLGVEC